MTERRKRHEGSGWHLSAVLEKGFLWLEECSNSWFLKPSVLKLDYFIKKKNNNKKHLVYIGVRSRENKNNKITLLEIKTYYQKQFFISTLCSQVSFNASLQTNRQNVAEDLGRMSPPLSLPVQENVAEQIQGRSDPPVSEPL